MRLLILAGALIATTDASAQPAQQMPLECQYTGAQMDWSACLRVTPRDAPWRPLVLINLGTEALMRLDYAGAVRYYDEAAPPGQQVYSDIVFHTYRGVAYWRVERNDEALRDAQRVYRMLHRDATLGVPPEQYLPPDLQSDVIYAFILPILQDLNAPEFQSALGEFMALPAIDWVSYANRSAVLQEIDDLPSALEMSGRALSMAPNEPAVLNNHCYIQLSLGHPMDALPYCERAVVAAPDRAEVRHSMAAVLASLGRCADAEREIAEARRIDPATREYQRSIPCNAR